MVDVGCADRERKIALIARRQNGVAGRDELLEAGLSGPAIDRRVRTGRLRPYFRGVYLVGPIAPPFARETAAVIACGSDAVLSHRSAAGLWQLAPAPHPSSRVEVTVPGRRTRGPAGIRLHYVRDFNPDETTRSRGIRVTTPARTLLDLACRVSTRDLEQALAQAERRYLTSRNKLLALIARYPARPGTPKLRQLLDGPASPALTRSKAEERFLGLIRRAGLPGPETNAPLHGHELDFLWRDEGVAVEIDGYAYHGDRESFEADRRRDAVLAAHGVQVIRITWRQIEAEPEATLVRVVQVLSLRR